MWFFFYFGAENHEAVESFMCCSLNVQQLLNAAVYFWQEMALDARPELICEQTTVTTNLCNEL